MFILLGLYIWVLYKHLFIYIDWDIGWDNSWDYAIYTLKRCQSGYFYLGFYYFTTFVLLELAILFKTQKLKTQQLKTQQLAKDKSKWGNGGIYKKFTK